MEAIDEFAYKLVDFKCFFNQAQLEIIYIYEAQGDQRLKMANISAHMKS